MKTYKRGIIKFLYEILKAHITAALLLFIVGSFFSSKISIILALIVYFFMMYLAIISENISFVVDDETKTVSYYKNGKLVKEYLLKDAELSYNARSGTFAKIDLKINEDIIDCEPLGRIKFESLYDHLTSLVEVKPQKIKVGE